MALCDQYRMNLRTLWKVVSAVVLGILFFGVIMGAAISLVNLNTQVSPEFAWFPAPVTLLLVAAIWLVERRWPIGLANPVVAALPAGRVYLIAVLVTAAGVFACAFNGYFTGYVRATELLGAEVDQTFQRTYAIYMSVLAAVLAEVAFRGIMQTRMQTVLGLWPVVIIIGLVNVFGHRWGPEITQNGFGLFVVLAGWTWLRAVSQSLWPPLIMHAGINLIIASWLWNNGAIEHAAMTPFATAVVGGLMVAGLTLSLWLARDSDPADPAGGRLQA